MGKHCTQCILYYRARLGGPIRARATRIVILVGPWPCGAVCCCAHAMASVCVAGPSRSGETAEEQTVSKHGSYR